MPNEYVTNQMHIRCISICSHIFIIIEYIMKRKRDQKRKKKGNGEIYQFHIV